jgi:hypothetical protein
MHSPSSDPSFCEVSGSRREVLGSWIPQLRHDQRGHFEPSFPFKRLAYHFTSTSHRIDKSMFGRTRLDDVALRHFFQQKPAGCVHAVESGSGSRVPFLHSFN